MSKNIELEFLHSKDPKFHISKEVEHEQDRRKRKGEEISQKPTEKISHFLEILEKTHLSHRDDPRVIERIKNYYQKKYVNIEMDNIPQSYWNNQADIMIRQGYSGDLQNQGVEKETTEEGKINYIFPKDMKEKELEVIRFNQINSLNRWVDYLSSPDADYPMWAKYWAFNSMLKMGKYEKVPHCPGCEKPIDKKNNFCSNCNREISDEKILEKARFQKRTESTTNSFPLLNSRALAKTISAMGSLLEEKSRVKKEKQKPRDQRDDDLLKLQIDNESKKLDKDEFIELLSTENFSKLYAQFLLEIPEYSTEGLRNIEGQWVKYDQYSEPDGLVKSFEGYPLEWCTANYDTAKNQLQGGDFHVYYSNNEEGEAKIPRLAVRMEGNNKIAEPPRGIAHDQNLDPYIHPVLNEKLSDFGQEGELYKQRIKDMEKLTDIWKRKEDKLNEEELRFIYELDRPIEGFGYQRDERIDEVIAVRKIKEDLPILFNCSPNQIATSQEDLRNNYNIKVYIGPLCQEVLNNNIEHIYTKFPGKEIRKIDMMVGDLSENQIKEKLNERKKISDYNNPNQITVSDTAKELLNHLDFKISTEKKELKLIKLSVADLGFPNGAKFQEIIAKGKELDLELCPPEVGPLLRLNYQKLMGYDQPKGEWIAIAMNPMRDSGGNPHGFHVYRSDDGGRYLHYFWANPDRHFGADNDFLFVRK